MTPSLKMWPAKAKAKEAAFPYEVKLILLDTNPAFVSLMESLIINFSKNLRGYTATVKLPQNIFF